MADLKSPFLIKLKGFLFLLTGAASAALVLLESPTLQTALLLGISIWSFCRFYYFAFYVIEHYVDANYRFSGLGSFVRYFFRKRHPRSPED